MRALRLSLAVSALVATLFTSSASAQCPMSTAAQPSLHANDVVLFADSFPAGAQVQSPGASWDTAQFADGAQSFVASSAPSNANHQVFVHQLHSPVNRLYAGDVLVAYALIDSCNTTQSITITWTTDLGYKSFYWGPEANAGNRYYVGPLPSAGTWARLEVDPATYGLTGTTYNGVILDNQGGRVWFDHVGKRTPVLCGQTAASPSGTFHADDQVFWDDAYPANSAVYGGPVWSAAQAASGTQSYTHPNAGLSNGQGAMGIFIASLGPHMVKSGETLFVYALIDPCMPSEQIAVTWTTQLGYKSAWWGSTNKMNVSGVHVGPLPAAGTWARLEIPVDTLAAGLHKKTFNGISTDTYGGRVWFDRPGKQNLPACVPAPGQPPTAGDALDPNDLVLIEDAMPAAGVVDAPGVVWDTNEKVSGAQSFTHPNAGTDGNGHSIFLHGLNSPAEKIRAGEKLVAYALVDACQPAQDISITWTTSIGYLTFYWGDTPANGRTRIGALPPAGTWARLEVDAGTYGLGGKTYNGVIFNNLDGRVWFDHVGKEKVPCTPPASEAPAAGQEPDVNDVLLIGDAFPAAGVVDAPGATWDTAHKVSGTQSFYHPNAGGEVHYSIFLHGLTNPAEKIRTGEKLIAYALIEACALNPTRELSVTWTTSLGYKTFYWGTNLNNSSTYMGPLPAAGSWTRLEVDADAVGLAGTTYNGVIVAHKDGKVWFDHIGKETVPCTPPASSAPAEPPTAQDVLLIDDAFPAYGVLDAPGVTWDTNVKLTGTQSFRHPNAGGDVTYSIFIHGLYTPQEKIKTGEKLIAYALVDACALNPTRQLDIIWTTSLGYKTFYWGTDTGNTADRFYMGALPVPGVWTRLEVDADTYGLSGLNKTYNGIVFSHTEGTVWFDHVGKEIVPCTPQTPGTPVDPPLGSDGVWFEDTFQEPGIVDAPGAYWDPARAASGTASMTMPASHFNEDGHNSIFAHGYNTPPFTVNAGDKLLFYYLTDECAPPQQIAITWTASNGYHTGWIGDNPMNLVEGEYFVRIGDLGPGGQWHRVELPATTLGIPGTTVNGLAVNGYGGRVWLDRIGRVCPTPAPVGGAPAPDANETVWIDDALPTGATQTGDGVWSTAYAASGAQSIAVEGGYGVFEHEINGATSTLVAGSGESLVTYVMFNECNVPKELVLSWRDAVSGQWKRAFWGKDTIYGNGMASSVGFYRMGPVPQGNRWVKLSVNPDRLGLTGVAIDGFRIESVDGQFWFDRVGKSTVAACADLDPVANTEWMWEEILISGDDSPPPGATVSANWTWDTSQQATGTSSHTDGFSFGAHQHSYTGANGTAFEPGSAVSVWVMISPCDPVREIMVGTGDHFVYFGEDLIPVPPGATKTRWPWGGLPQPGTWYQIWIPDWMLDIGGTTVTEFTFAAYDGQAWFDRLSRIAAYADVTSITADQPSPHPAGSPITFTSTATGIAPVEYQYEIYNRTTGVYTIVRPYSTDNTWTWTPTTAEAGNYYVYGEARNAGSQWWWEDYEIFELTITP